MNWVVAMTVLHNIVQPQLVALAAPADSYKDSRNRVDDNTI